MKILKKLNCVVKGKEIEVIEGMNKGETGIIIKIGGCIPAWGCVFHILINNKICEYPSRFFKFTDDDMQNYFENTNDEFEIED